VRTTRWPVTNDCSNGDLLQPRLLGIAKRRTGVRQSLYLCGDIDQEPSWNSTQIAESHGRLSEQTVEVTGSCLSINPDSLMPRWFLIFCLVLRAVNVPSIKKYPLIKRKLFVTVSNPETTANLKTADVRVEGQMAKWNQNLDPL
jgi:hypothetical protein